MDIPSPKISVNRNVDKDEKNYWPSQGQQIALCYIATLESNDSTPALVQGFKFLQTSPPCFSVPITNRQTMD
jgi:hypothetical protein